MSEVSDDNPFFLVFNAFWEMLEANDFLVKLVKPKNRIKIIHDRERDPFKDSISTGDLPEIIVVPTGSTPHIQRTSNSSFITERYAIKLSTGQQTLNTLFQIKWEIYKSLANWIVRLQALQWKSTSFVHLARPTNIDDGMADVDLIRGIDGWISVWACEIDMHFSTSQLITDLLET